MGGAVFNEVSGDEQGMQQTKLPLRASNISKRRKAEENANDAWNR
jgi:hypothetical protein